MVDGIVRPPSLDLANRDLVESHLHAEWLAASGVDLESVDRLNLDMTEPGKPLLPSIGSWSSSAESKRAGTREPCGASSRPWPWTSA